MFRRQKAKSPNLDTQEHCEWREPQKFWPSAIRISPFFTRVTRSACSSIVDSEFRTCCRWVPGKQLAPSADERALRSNDDLHNTGATMFVRAAFVNALLALRALGAKAQVAEGEDGIKSIAVCPAPPSIYIFRVFGCWYDGCVANCCHSSGHIHCPRSVPENESLTQSRAPSTNAIRWHSHTSTQRCRADGLNTAETR